MEHEFSMIDMENEEFYKQLEEMGIVTKLELPKGLKELLDDLEEAEERNDVCIYKTLRYPPRSTPPATD